MRVPISPPPVRRWRPEYLPAYVGNGVIGLRAPRTPFLGGWRSIEVDRIWVRGRPARLSARHGVDRSHIEVT